MALVYGDSYMEKAGSKLHSAHDHEEPMEGVKFWSERYGMRKNRLKVRRKLNQAFIATGVLNGAFLGPV